MAVDNKIWKRNIHCCEKFLNLRCDMACINKNLVLKICLRNTKNWKF